MVELPHVLVGAAIATKIGNPWFALPLAFGSHFILDLIPHANPHIYTEIKKNGKLQPKTLKWIVLDSSIALFSGLFIASQSLPDINRAIIVVLASFLAVLPDLFEVPYYFFKIRHPFMLKMVEFEHSMQGRLPAIPGALVQLIVSTAALWWVFGR